MSLGNNVSVEKLYRDHGTTVHWVARRIVKNSSDAEDITQEAFMCLMGVFKKNMEIRNERAFLLKTATNLALNYVRHVDVVLKSTDAVADHQRLIVNFEDTQTEARSVDQIETEEARKMKKLNAAIKQLPPKCKTAFILCKVKGYTYQQAAQKMNVSPSMIKKHVQRGMSLCNARIRRNTKPEALNVGGLDRG